MKIALTGAAGFIGFHLVPALLKAGYDVAGTVEPDGADCDAGVPLFPADIVSGEGMHAAFRGAEAVIHLAALNHVLRDTAADPLSAYRRVNVDGTRNTARAASRCGAKLFIHMSSVKAMGEASDRILDEEAPCAPTTPYGISKLESEEAVGIEAAGTGMKAVILRLPLVYGPRNRGNLPRMIRWADRGLPFPLFRPDNLRSLIYVENVVAGILAVLQRPMRETATFILKDREDYSTRRVFSAVCRALGRTPHFLPVPAWAVRVGGVFSEDFRRVAGSFRVSAAKAERELGYFPLPSLEEGIERTVAWYRRSGR